MAGKKSKKTGAKRVAAKPTLLAGGNPQIAKADGDAPVQAYIAAMPGWKSNVGRRLDALVVKSVPGVRKAVKWNSPFYGIGGEGWFLSFHTFTKYVKVTFFRGRSLRPMPPGESKHDEVRYLDIREDDPLDEAQLKRWIRQAAALPGWSASAPARPRAAVRSQRGPGVKKPAKAAEKAAAEKSSDPRAASKRIEKKIAELGDWRGARLAEIRKLIHEVDPEVVEEWKWMGTPVWSHHGMYVLANAHKDKVKITFFHGAKLRDPDKLFNAGLSGNKWRAIDLREADRIDKTAFKALLREALAYNTTHSVPKSKGSRA